METLNLTILIWYNFPFSTKWPNFLNFIKNYFTRPSSCTSTISPFTSIGKLKRQKFSYVKNLNLRLPFTLTSLCRLSLFPFPAPFVYCVWVEIVCTFIDGGGLLKTAMQWFSSVKVDYFPVWLCEALNLNSPPFSIEPFRHAKFTIEVVFLVYWSGIVYLSDVG